jgi:hypothetical protein
MRQFNITINWTEVDHTDVFTHVFAPEHTKEITADEFLSMMLGCVSKSLSECSTDAKNYMERSLMLPEYVEEMGNGIIESVEEIDA